MRTFQAWSLPRPLPGAVVEERDPGLAGSAAHGWEVGLQLTVNRLRLGPQQAGELLRDLREAREALADRPVAEIVSALGRVGARFLDPADELRREALDTLPPTAGLSPQMAARVLDGMAGDWCTPRLERVLEVDLGGGAALDGFVPDGDGRKCRGLGAPLSVHVCAGTVPGVSVTSMVRALMVKSSVLLKPGSGDVVLPVLFRRGLVESDRSLAAATAVVYWPGGSGEAIERVALGEADLVVVYGGDDSVRAVRGQVAGTTPVVAYPHRVSFGVVGPEALAGGALRPTAAAASRAVALFDQRGCVSPHLFYVLGDGGDAVRFAEALADALRGLELELPAGALDVPAAVALQQLRGTAELLAASGQGRIWRGAGTDWTVVWDPEPSFEPSCLGRTVRVKPVESVNVLLDLVRPYRRHLQTVGVAGLESATLNPLAEGLARLGPARLAPLDAAPWPPPWWHHDGMGPLASLVRFTDLEEGID